MYRELIMDDNFRWSFSKLETFCDCKRRFYLEYLLSPTLLTEQNAFGEYGTHCHKILEGWAKGQIVTAEMAQKYDDEYPDNVIHSFPPYPKGYAQKAYEQGLEYFKRFNGFGDDMEVLSAEEKFEINIAGNVFVGIVDLVLKDKNTGEITIIDHKTKSESSMRKELRTYRKQLYTYAAFCKQKYGVFPKYLKFNMIKTGEFITEEFSEDEYNKTMQWIEDTIDMAKFEECWDRKSNNGDFFCNWICDVCNYCDTEIELK